MAEEGSPFPYNASFPGGGHPAWLGEGPGLVDDDGAYQQYLQNIIEQLHAEVISNWTTQNTVDKYDILKRPAWRGVILALYVSVIVVGVIGNGIVVYIVSCNRNMQNITNIFIATLALSDIGLCVFSLPVQLHYQMTDTWIFGTNMCRVVFAAFAVPMYVSTLTILLIAFDRYWLIVFPLKQCMTKQLAFVSIVVAFVVSIVLSVPVMMYSSLHSVEEPDIGFHRTYCLELWPSDRARMVYTVLMFTFQFCVPLAMTALLYYRIYCRLRQRPTSQHRSSTAAHNERKQKTNKILVAIVMLFVICWLPWNLFSLLTEINIDLVRGRHFKFLDLLLKVFAMGSACINPFLYCWLNENFRKELDNMAIKLHLMRDTRRGGGASGRHLAASAGYKATGDDTMAATEHTVMVDRTSVVQIERNSVSYYPPDNILASNGKTGATAMVARDSGKQPVPV